MQNKFSFFILATLIFLVVLSTHFLCRITTSSDSKWFIPLALSIIHEGNADLDEYSHLIDARDYRIERVKGHYYTIYHLGVPVLITPFIFITEKLSLDIPPEKFLLEQKTVFETIERLLASMFVAITAVIIFLISIQLVDNTRQALFLVFIFAYGTSAWSTASRALWQHGPSMLMLSISLYMILLSREKPWLIQFLSIPLAYSYVIRPTNCISIAVFTLYVFLQHRKYFGPYVLWSLTISVPFFLYNHYIYGTWLTWYYQPRMIGSNPDFIAGMLGTLFSPSRGLFIYTPVFIFSIGGIFILMKNVSTNILKHYIVLIIILHSAMIFSYINWWGGSGTYGPRMFTDMIPFFIFLLAPVFRRLSSKEGRLKKLVIVVLIIFISTGFLIHLRGATSEYPYVWNKYPVDIDRNPMRVWDWKDIQFLRGLPVQSLINKILP